MRGSWIVSRLAPPPNSQFKQYCRLLCVRWKVSPRLEPGFARRCYAHRARGVIVVVMFLAACSCGPEDAPRTDILRESYGDKFVGSSVALPVRLAGVYLAQAVL